ncbi:hypothetical protein ACT4VL_04680 [Acinetobacter baumannii]|uniref:hypothetical protein n=1 Tax=Acinetobacter pittii TaxID=48296 RepID=UPI00233E8796|nr:hypothetical protein [Acinetobacter baumannii]
MTNSDNNKKSANKLFLFTSEGNKAVFDYMRNLTPQVLIFSVGVVFTIRTYELPFSNKSIILGLVAFAMFFVFIYLIMANIIDFIDKISNFMYEEIKKIEGYKKDKDLSKFKYWFTHLIGVLSLTFKKKRSLVYEFILALVFLIIPSVVVFITSGHTAISIYRSLFGG